MIYHLPPRLELSGKHVLYDIPEGVIANQKGTNRYRSFSTVDTLVEELTRKGPLVAITNPLPILPPKEKSFSFARYLGLGTARVECGAGLIVVGAKNGAHGDFVYCVICVEDPRNEDSSTKTYRPLDRKVHEISHRQFFHICEELYSPIKQ